jgi:hypothetical protein
MLDQPTNGDHNQYRKTRFIRVRKAHSRAFVWQKTPDCELIVWLAEIMINLHKNRARRARWSGPCGQLNGCRLDRKDLSKSRNHL